MASKFTRRNASTIGMFLVRKGGRTPVVISKQVRHFSGAHQEYCGMHCVTGYGKIKKTQPRVAIYGALCKFLPVLVNRSLAADA